jgi:MFS family permease
MSNDSQAPRSIGGVNVGDPRIRAALVAATYDGVFATIMLGIVEIFGIAGAVSLEVPSAPISLLGPLPLWLGALLQLVLGRRVVKGPRKPWVVGAVTIQATTLLGLALTFWAPANWAKTLYVCVFVLYGASNAAVGHLWMSWIADLCPEAVLGRHIAWRSSIFAVIQLGVATVAGVLARGFSSATASAELYTTAFVIAALARYVSAWFLSIQYEPKVHAPPPVPERFRPSTILTRYAKGNALFQGSVLLAQPFLAVYCLRELGFSYLEFGLAGMSTLAGQLVANRFAGRLADECGAARVLALGGWLTVLSLVPYLFITSPPAVWLTNFFGGVALATVTTASFKYLVQASRGLGQRPALAYANLWHTSVTLILGFSGGLVASRLPVVFAWPLQTLFLISLLLRAAVVVVVLRRLTELDTAVTVGMPRSRGRLWWSIGRVLTLCHRNVTRGFCREPAE